MLSEPVQPFSVKQVMIHSLLMGQQKEETHDSLNIALSGTSETVKLFKFVVLKSD